MTTLRECHDCGLIQRVPPLRRHAVARCPRCRAVLRRKRTDPSLRALALCLTGLILFALADQLDFMRLSVGGRQRDMTLITGPTELGQTGMWEVGAVVLATTIAFPLIRLICLAWVLLGLRLRRRANSVHIAFRWFARLAPWSMIEVFMLGVLVAYTKLVDLADVHVGAAVYALAALMLVQVATDALLDRDAVWDQIGARGIIAPSKSARPVAPADPVDIIGAGRALVGCDCCGLVVPPARACPRCGTTLRRRKPASIARTTALLVSGAILYIPANILPVMTYVKLGREQSNTIASGVVELANSGMWPLALLVFFASITVPVLKLLGLAYLLLTTSAKSRRHLMRRTVIYRIVDAIGRWSMIDVFMISILTALVRLGSIVSVFPAPGVMAFCSVVILTMLAAITFDPRLMWDVNTRDPLPAAARAPHVNAAAE